MYCTGWKKGWYYMMFWDGVLLGPGKVAVEPLIYAHPLMSDHVTDGIQVNRYVDTLHVHPRERPLIKRD